MLEQYHVFVIGAIASVLVWAIKQWTKNSGKQIPSAVLTIGVYVVSLGLAVWWSVVKIPGLPPFAGDLAAYMPLLLAWFNDVLMVVGGYVAFATLIYQAFVKYLLEQGIPMAWRSVLTRVRGARA